MTRSYLNGCELKITGSKAWLLDRAADEQQWVTQEIGFRVPDNTGVHVFPCLQVVFSCPIEVVVFAVHWNQPDTAYPRRRQQQPRRRRQGGSARSLTREASW